MLNSQRLKLLLITVLVFLAASAGVTSVLIVERQQTLERVSRYNLTWVMSQGVPASHPIVMPTIVGNKQSAIIK